MTDPKSDPGIPTLTVLATDFDQDRGTSDAAPPVLGRPGRHASPAAPAQSDHALAPPTPSRLAGATPPRAPGTAPVPALGARADQRAFTPDSAQSELPVLTEAVNAAQGTLPPEPVLRAALQAELEHTIQTALEQATADVMRQVRRQLEDELPGVVDRVINRLRPG